jgi:hypothetical protein
MQLHVVRRQLDVSEEHATMPRLETQAKLRSVMISYIFPLFLLALISTLKMGVKCSCETSWYIRTTLCYIAEDRSRFSTCCTLVSCPAYFRP